MSASDLDCALCGLPVADTPIRDGDGLAFCCQGCRHVHEVLGDAPPGLDDDGSVDAARIRDALTDVDGGPSEHDEGVDVGDQTDETAFLRVDGMHCSTCESFIEAVAGSSEGVTDAEASYVTETVRVEYDAERTDLETIRDGLSRMGYRAYQRETELDRRAAENRLFGRMVAGILFGMMVMLQYVVIVYPTYFGGLFYDDRTAAYLSQALATGSGRYFFVAIWVLTTIVLLYTGGPILRGAYVSLRTRQPNMDLLIAVAAVSAYLYSAITVVLGGTDIYFDVTVAIVVVVTVGNYYERSVKRAATERLTALTSAQVSAANRLSAGGDHERIPISAVEPGDRLLVRAGERIPLDGEVDDGAGAVDESIVTGESRPRWIEAGAAVIGGAVLVDGAIEVAVDDEPTSTVDRITNVVWRLQSSNHGIQRLADRLATLFVPGVLVLGLLVALGYLVAGAGPATAVLVGLTVLIVSCPCALGLATPLAVATGVRDALKRGIVVFDDTVFERLRGTDVVVFDKTGTLTTGDMTVLEADAPEGALASAAVLERRSAHPVARAIVTAFGDDGGDDSHGRGLPDGGLVEDGDGVATSISSVGADHDESLKGPMGDDVTDFQSHPNGVSGRVRGETVLVGHPDRFRDEGWTVPQRLLRTVEDARGPDRVPVLVGREGTAEGVIVIGDERRIGWEDILSTFADRGIETVVLTGDDEAAAASFREHESVDRVFAGVPPEAKAETVARLRSRGRVTMVGDGTNDAPALAAADLGIALGGGTALAADAADVAILSDDLTDIALVFDLASAAGRRVKENVAWAFLYNGIAIPVAIAGLLNPLFAAVAMALSSLLVVTNSSRALLEETAED